ncbi:MAG: GTPase [Isosphaeraceae bacterium]
MLRNWRAWILLLLLVGPILVYIGFGALWLYEHHWLLIAGAIWIAAGLAFSFLAARWTRSQNVVLPPIDWDSPATFSRADREAWAIVESEAERGDRVSLDQLVGADIYIETGRSLARQLAHHYHPLATDPIERVPVIDLLTALELAAEDLTQLCRQIPGGDLITPDHWKKAIKVAGYIQRANDIYSYLLPIFSPVTGLVRLGTQQWMVKPAWRDMQQNLLRWFFRAYVNRLGTHLIELYSGRLAIGADQYRRLTRRLTREQRVVDTAPIPITIAVAGARGSGKSRLIDLSDQAKNGDFSLLRARLTGAGIDEAALDRLKEANWIEVPGYTVSTESDSARDRATRKEAVAQAVVADLLVLVIDARRDTNRADAAFAREWDNWFLSHPALEAPPALAVLSGLDHPDLGGEWSPPYQWEKGQGPREEAVRARITALRTTLPPAFAEIVAVGLPERQPFGVIEHLLPALCALSYRAERNAVIRHLQSVSSRSKAGRLFSQVATHGKSLWGHLRSRKERGTSASS